MVNIIRNNNSATLVLAISILVLLGATPAPAHDENDTANEDYSDHAMIINEDVIATVDDAAVGISSKGHATIINGAGARIVTRGADAHGILSTGDDATIINDGTIHTGAPVNVDGVLTNKNGSHGILSEGADAAITNSGTIITGGDGNRVESMWLGGIRSRGPRAIITNTGTITNSGDYADGIGSDGDNAIITNEGAITTAGNVSVGIWSSGNHTMITNKGTIITKDTGGGPAYGPEGDTTPEVEDSYGIGSIGADARITNSGTITTAGIGAHGIWSEGADAAITNSGTIITGGDGNRVEGMWLGGIRSRGPRAIITNTGTITTSGDYADGIGSDGGNNAIITNEGAITTAGNVSVGIWSSGNHTMITNKGTIITKDTGGGPAYGPEGNTTPEVEDSYGIGSIGADARITNSGTITTAGIGAHGIWSIGAEATITNSGVINAAGGASSISALGKDATINLLKESQLLGAIDFTDSYSDVEAGSVITRAIDDTQGDTLNIKGYRDNQGLRWTSTTIGVNHTDAKDTINIEGPSASIVVTNRGCSNDAKTCKNAYVVDPTGQAVDSAVLSSLTGTIHRLAATRTLAGQSAAKDLKPVAWSGVFGSVRERDDESNVQGYDHEYAGFVGGYEFRMGDTSVGLMAGYARSDVDTDIASIEKETDSYFGGADIHYRSGPVKMIAAVIGGYEGHDNVRAVADNAYGEEKAKADIDSAFLSPSITIATAYPLNHDSTLTLHPSASFTYSIAWYDSYRESGTARSNLSINDRTVGAITGRLQLALAYRMYSGSSIEVRSGGTARYTDDEDIDAMIQGTRFTMASNNDDSVHGGFIGGTYRHQVAENIRLTLAGEYAVVSGGEDRGGGYTSLEVQF